MGKRRFANAGFFFAVANWIVSVIVVALLFGLIFKVLPGVDVRWKDVEIDALATAFLFVIWRALIGLYIERTRGSCRRLAHAARCCRR